MGRNGSARNSADDYLTKLNALAAGVPENAGIDAFIISQWPTWSVSRSEQPSTAEASLVFVHDVAVAARRFRDIGIQSWAGDRNWAHRIQWLRETMDEAPEYYLDFMEGLEWQQAGQPFMAEIDPVAKADGDARFATLRAEAFASGMLSARDLQAIRYMELSKRILRLPRAWLKDGDKSQSLIALNDIWQLYDVHADAEGARELAVAVFQNAAQYGLNDADLGHFIHPMLECPDETLRNFAQAKQRFLALKSTPLELRAPTLAGQPFDIASLRGKIVLLDFWATTCASCIGAMPRMKDIYDRYKNRGFEVVSICFDGQQQRPKLERVERQLELTWVTLAADSVRTDIKGRFGYSSVPEYMLLDRSGRLVAGTAEIDMGRNLEALLEKMLAAEGAR